LKKNKRKNSSRVQQDLDNFSLGLSRYFLVSSFGHFRTYRLLCRP